MERTKARDGKAAKGRTLGKAARLHRIQLLLERRPMTAVELAEDLGVPVRNVQRDLVSLRKLLGVELLPDHANRYRLEGRVSSLNDLESLALYSAARLLQRTGVGERHFREAMDKLAAQVPEPAQGVLQARLRELRSGPMDRTFDQVARAWLQKRVLRCRYDSANSGVVEERDLEIYLVEWGRNHEAYARAFDRTKRKDVLTFRLARLTPVKLLDETYEIPPDRIAELAKFNADGIVDGEEIEVAVRVEADTIKRFRENEYFSWVRDEVEPDGRTLVTLRTNLDSHGRALEIVPRLLGWGDRVEVVSPVAVREEVAKKLASAARKYAA